MRFPRRGLLVAAMAAAAAVLFLRRPGQPLALAVTGVSAGAPREAKAVSHDGGTGGTGRAGRAGRAPPAQSTKAATHIDKKPPRTTPPAKRKKPDEVLANKLANQAARAVEIAETRKLETIASHKTPFCNVCEHEFVFVGVSGVSGQPVNPPAVLEKLLSEIPGYTIDAQHGGQFQHWERLWSAINQTNFQPAGLYAWKHLDIGLAEVSCMVQRWLVEPADPKLSAPLHGTHHEVRGYYFQLKPSGAPLPFLLSAFPCARVVLVGSKAELPVEVGRVYEQHADSGRVVLFDGSLADDSADVATPPRVQRMLDWLGAGCSYVGNANDDAPMLECAQQSVRWPKRAAS